MGAEVYIDMIYVTVWNILKIDEEQEKWIIFLHGETFTSHLKRSSV